MRIVLTRQLAHAAGMDAGNASMRRSGRKTWSPEDFKAAAEVTNRLLDVIEGNDGKELVK